MKENLLYTTHHQALNTKLYVLEEGVNPFLKKAHFHKYEAKHKRGHTSFG